MLAAHALCACALRKPVFLGSLSCQKGRCAPPQSIAASLLLIHPPPKKNNLQYFQKQNASLQAQTRAARGVYLSTGLSCTQLSYIAPYLATLQPPELCCALFWATLHPVELRCTLISYAAFNWAILQPIWAMMHPKSYASPYELSSTLLSYVAPYLSYAAPYLSYAAP